MSNIKMPVYHYEDDDCKKCGNYGSIKSSQKLCTDCNGDGLKKHYDFEEMANELENRICEALNRNVLITISELDDDMDKDDMDINDLTFKPTEEE